MAPSLWLKASQPPAVPPSDPFQPKYLRDSWDTPAREGFPGYGRDVRTVRENLIDRGDVRLYYSVAGEAERSVPLLLSHGFSASSAMWEPNLSELAASRRVITWDIRGHGQTVVPPRPELYSHDASLEDMAAVLDACGLQSTAVGGLSLGGYLSLAFYNRYPERVRALLLFDTGPGYRNDEGRQGWNNYAVSQAERLETAGLDALGNSREVTRGVHDPHGLALAARYILTQQGSEVIESLDSIDVPTLVLVGELDRAFLKAADYMASHIPRSKKVVLPGAGHAANIDQPEAFNRAVEDFLATLTQPGMADHDRREQRNRNRSATSAGSRLCDEP